jgi:uncharacterized membrane protein YhaH (DUF805 family)
VDALRLFTSFQGRIGRPAFLIGIVVVVLLSPLALALLFAKTGIVTMLAKLGIGGMVWWLVLLWPVTALIVKRLRDRQRPVWWAAFFLLPALLVIIGTYSAWGDAASAFIGLTNVALLAIGIWLLIELGARPSRLPVQTLANTGAAKSRPKPKRAKA